MHLHKLYCNVDKNIVNLYNCVLYTNCDDAQNIMMLHEILQNIILKMYVTLFCRILHNLLGFQNSIGARK